MNISTSIFLFALAGFGGGGDHGRMLVCVIPSYRSNSQSYSPHRSQCPFGEQLNLTNAFCFSSANTRLETIRAFVCSSYFVCLSYDYDLFIVNWTYIIRWVPSRCARHASQWQQMYVIYAICSDASAVVLYIYFFTCRYKHLPCGMPNFNILHAFYVRSCALVSLSFSVVLLFTLFVAVSNYKWSLQFSYYDHL